MRLFTKFTAIMAGLSMAALSTCTTAGATTEPTPPEPVRLMFVGDSMTHGLSGDTTYRYYVWREFVEQGVPVEIVGPRADLNNYDGNADSYTQPTYTDANGVVHDFDKDHEAQAGSTFESYVSTINGSHTGRVDDFIQDYAPDVIVLGLGYNDSAGSTTDNEIFSRVKTYINKVHSVDPTVKVVFNEIIDTNYPETHAKAGQPQDDAGANYRNQRTYMVNKWVKDWVANGGPAGPVDVALIRQGNAGSSGNVTWNADSYSFDGIHPNETGQTLFAHRIAESLGRLGVLGTSGPGIFTSVTWQPEARVNTVSDHGDAVSIWFSAEKDRVSATAMQIRVFDANTGEKVRQSGWITEGWNYENRYYLTRDRLPAGDYYATAQPERYKQRGAQGHYEYAFSIQ